MKVFWIFLNIILYLWYNNTDLISVLIMFYQEQKYTGILTMPSMYVFVGNKNMLLRTKIYGSKLLNNLMLHRNNKLVWTWVNGHNFDTGQNGRLFCGCQQKNQSPQMFPLCIQQQQQYMVYWNNIHAEHGEQWWLVCKQQNMEKWTRIRDGELLSYSGIDFQKPIDEEQLVKEIKRRKKINNMKLDNTRKKVVQKKEHWISRSSETSGKL